MTNLLVSLLGVLLSTNQPAAASNLVAQTTGLTVRIPDPSDPVEKEFHKLMEDDDAATDEVDRWIQENNSFAQKGAGLQHQDLNTRIRARLAPVKKAYEDFIARHPDHARARLAYGTFLEDTHDEDGAIDQFEKARELDPSNPAAWNQAADFYTHRGPVSTAFEYLTKAIELNPREPVYYQNLATVVYLFRTDSKKFYHINGQYDVDCALAFMNGQQAAGKTVGFVSEQVVFNMALALYEHAVRLDPTNFDLSQDLAQTYYGIKPTRTEAALNAWTNCLKIATTDLEREGVYIHLARFKLNADRFAEAHQHLTLVTNSYYDDLKNRLLRNLKLREEKTPETNTPAAAVSPTPSPPPK